MRAKIHMATGIIYGLRLKVTKKSAFVTGGTGFLGLNLVEELVRQSWQVTALHRPTSNIELIKRFPVELIEGDILDLNSLYRAIPGNVDAVFHLAADKSVWSSNKDRQGRINVKGTENLVEAALVAHARRFIYTSTWTTYGLSHDIISEDTTQLGEKSRINYVRTKYLAEKEIRARSNIGLDAIILNPANIFGRYDETGWAQLIINTLERWVPGLPPGAGNFCSAESVAKAHISAYDRGRSGANYLLGGPYASFVEVFQIISRVTSSPVTTRTLPAFVFRIIGSLELVRAKITRQQPIFSPEAAEVLLSQSRIISERAETELAYKSSDLVSMIGDCYEWLVKCGRLPHRY